MDRARGPTVDIFPQTLPVAVTSMRFETDIGQLFFRRVRRPLRPRRRVPVGLLLLPAWVTTTGDACMAIRPEASSHSDDEI